VLHLCARSQNERIFDINAEIANGAFNLRMTEKDLDSAQVASLIIDNGSLRSPQ
jgi:hypothetical protein